MGEGAGERRVGDPWHEQPGRRDGSELIALARRYGRLDDPQVRDQLARALARRELNALNTARAQREAEGSASSPLMSLGKLAMSRILHGDARLMTEILGAASLYDGAGHPDAADANYRTANAYMTSIGGGTDQIQLNIIGERVLGLPREIELDRDVPFRHARSSV
jgi:alkylation response protein AidB-like acyl-CoA dehydrogenase